jgi:Tfp pilus assembly protein PilO
MMTKMSPRERTLLVIFAILLVGALYYLFFLSPLQSKTDAVTAQIADTEDEMDAAQIKLQQKKTMQDELDKIFADANGDPTKIPDYDNVQAVIQELNKILSESDQYTLDFGELEDSTNSIIRRPVSLSFSCSSYDAVRSILEQLGSSEFRSLITDVSITNNEEMSGNYTAAGNDGNYAYSVSAQINFYEYSETPLHPAEETNDTASTQNG